MDSGKRPVAQTALLIVAPLVLLAYAGIGGWLWWADHQDAAQEQHSAAPAPVTDAESHDAKAQQDDDAPSPPDTGHSDGDHSAGGDDPAAKGRDGEPPPEVEDSQATAADDDHAAPGQDAATESARKPEDKAPATVTDDDAETGKTERGSADAGHATVPADLAKAGDESHTPTPAEPGHDADVPEGVDHNSPAEETRPVPGPAVTAEPETVTPDSHNQSAAKSAYTPAPLPASSPLKPAPDPDLTIRGRYGPLPMRADDGREAWQVYGRPFERRADARIIALVITELGLAEPPTLSAIQDLPGEVTLAFTPYSRRLAEWVPAARAAGHEVLLQVPMEPRNIELNDPGDKALLTTNDPEVNLDRLEWVMSRATGYVGLTSFMGSRMTVSENDMRPVLDAIAARGLAYIDPKVTPVSIAGKLAQELGLPAVSSDRFIDQQAARDPIDRRLGQLEQIALSRGSAVGFAQAYPVTIERLRKWIPEMQKRGFVLAPISAVVSR